MSWKHYLVSWKRYLAFPKYRSDNYQPTQFSFYQHINNPKIAKPKPPRNVHANEIYSDSCVLHWKPPEDDGGTPITNYIIEVDDKDDRGSKWTHYADVSPEEVAKKIDGLKKGHKYKVRVTAVNKMGKSEPTEIAEPFVAKDPWGEFLCLVMERSL